MIIAAPERLGAFDAGWKRRAAILMLRERNETLSGDEVDIVVRNQTDLFVIIELQSSAWLDSTIFIANGGSSFSRTGRDKSVVRILSGVEKRTWDHTFDTDRRSFERTRTYQLSRS